MLFFKRNKMLMPFYCTYEGKKGIAENFAGNPNTLIFKEKDRASYALVPRKQKHLLTVITAEEYYNG